MIHNKRFLYRGWKLENIMTAKEKSNPTIYLIDFARAERCPASDESEFEINYGRASNPAFGSLNMQLYFSIHLIINFPFY